MALIETLVPGIPYPTLIDSIFLLAVSILVSRIVYVILHATFGRVSAKTRTNLDDLLFRAISKPVLLGGLLVGLYLVSVTWDFLLPYMETSHLIFTVAGIVYAGFVLIRIINALLEWYMEEVAARTQTKKDEQFLPIVRKVLYGVVGLIILLWIMNQFGIEITTLVAAMGIGGLAVALALQDTLKEFFAGTHVIVDRPIRIGDFIELESGDKGTVMDIGWRSTTIKTFTGNHVVLPNSKIASSKLINYDMPRQELGFSIDVGVGYGEDLEKVERVTLDVANKVLEKSGAGAEGFKPFMRYQGFGDSNIDLKVIFRVKKYSDQFAVKHDFIKALKKEYDRKGIEIAWPIRKVYMAKKKVD
jgi:small-conductance mechanosensitive channel